MAAEQMIVEAITRTTLEGADKAIADAQKLDSALSGVAVANDRMGGAIAVSERQLNSLLRQIDPAYKSSQDLAKGEALLTRAFEQGRIPVEEFAARLEQLRARYENVASAATKAANATKSSLTSTAIDANLGISANSNSSRRAEDIEAYGKSLDDLRAKFSPLFANERDFIALQEEINQAFKVGAIDETERAAAIQRAETTFKRANDAVRGYGQAAKLSGNDLRLLSFQVNDIVTQLSLGQSVFRTLASQGGQLFQVWQMSGLTVKETVSSLGETVSGIGTRVLSLLTPARAVFGGIAGAVVTAGLALKDYLDEQKAIENSLNGLGAASGATVDQIRAIAGAAADASGISKAAANEIAISLLNTGKIAKESLGGIIELTRNFSIMMGTDAQTAAKELSKAFSDPAKGAEQLTGQLHFLDGATLSYIKSLQAQGRATEAAVVLQEKLRQRLADADKQLGFFARTNAAWAKSFEDMWHSVEEGMGKAFAPTATQQLEKLIDARERMLNGPKNSKTDAAIEYLDNLIAKAREAVGAEEAVAAAKRQVAKMNDASIAGDQITGSLQPAIAQYQTLLEQRQKLVEALKNPAMLADAEATRQALAMVTAAINDYAQAGSAIELAQQKLVVSHNLEIQAINAKTVAEQAEIAFKQTYLSLIGQAVSEEDRLTQAKAAQEMVIARARDQANELVRSMEDQIEAVKLENRLMDESYSVRNSATEAMKAEQQIRRMGLDLYSEEANRIREVAQALADATTQRQLHERANQIQEENFRKAQEAQRQAEQEDRKAQQEADRAERERQDREHMLKDNQQITLQGQKGTVFQWSPFTGGSFVAPKNLSKDFETADDYFNRKRGIAPATNDNTASGSSSGSALDPISALVEKLQQKQDAVMNRAYTPSAYTDKNADYFYDGSRIYKDQQDKIYDGLQQQINSLTDLLAQGKTLIDQNANMPAAFAQALTTALMKAGLTAEQIAQALSGFKTTQTGSAQGGTLQNRMGMTALRTGTNW